MCLVSQASEMTVYGNMNICFSVTLGMWFDNQCNMAIDYVCRREVSASSGAIAAARVVQPTQVLKQQVAQEEKKGEN